MIGLFKRQYLIIFKAEYDIKKIYQNVPTRIWNPYGTNTRIEAN